MLLWTRRSRIVMWSIFAAVVLIVFVAPLLTVIVAGMAGSWTSALPSDLGFARFGTALSGENLASLSVSLQTAFAAGTIALVIGTWAALATAGPADSGAGRVMRRVTDVVFHLPVAVPSVAIGLGVLITFNKRPLLLGGTRWIVILAHTALVLAFAFSAVSAAVARLDPLHRQVAASLGAGRLRILTRVTLPLLLPALGAAAGLSIALSMGELGATVMVYPASWKTLPVSIFGLTDRGQIFDAATLTTILLTVTLVLLAALGRIRTKAALR